MTDWLTAPDPLPPPDDNVHVWVVNLDAGDFDAIRWPAQLSPDEREHADRLKFARDRRRYIVAHVALRAILAAYLNINGENLKFRDGENGKPRLARPLGESALEFNLSHSDERALIAVARTQVVGVDIEFMKSDFAFHEVADHFFTKREVSALTALPPALQRQAFYKCWTSKEAFLKAKGLGLSGTLDEVQPVCIADSRVRINADVPGWSLIELDPGDGYEGALVVEGAPAPIRCYRWQASP